MGSRWGRWTVTGVAELKNGKQAVPVVCDCGQQRVVHLGNLLLGKTKSCGCLSKVVASDRLRTHGMSGTPIYRVWNAMRRRCNQPNYPAYKNYGGRGVKVCERWNSFENFYADVGDAPFAGASLDRTDNNGDYEPNNIKWASKFEQANNTRRSVRFQVFGQSISIREAAEKYGLPQGTLRRRVYSNGMDLEEAVTHPLMTRSEAGRRAGSGGWGRTNKRTDGTKLYASNPESPL